MNDLNETKRQVHEKLESFIGTVYPQGKLTNNGKHVALANKEGSPPKNGGSFRIALTGEHRGIGHDFSTGETVDVLDMPMHALGFTKGQSIQYCKDFVGSGGNICPNKTFSNVTLSKKTEAGGLEKPDYGTADYRNRYMSRLKKSSAACDYLSKRGLGENLKGLIDHFQLGLSEPSKHSPDQHSALMCPVRDWRNGQFFKRNLMYNIPGVSVNPLDNNSWMKGSTLTYPMDKYSGQKDLFIAEGAKDLWALWDHLRDTGVLKNLFIVTSTHGSGIPKEWDTPEFWNTFETIYCGHDNDAAGEKTAWAVAKKAVEVAGKKCVRVCPPGNIDGKDWTDFFVARKDRQGASKEFEVLLFEAPIVSEPRVVVPSGATGTTGGKEAYNPIDINGAYHNGHLYYVTQEVIWLDEVEQDANGNKAIVKTGRKESIVVRSDRSVLKAFMMKAPKGTPTEDRLILLSDSTIIHDFPRPSRYASWSYASIQAYLAGNAQVRPLRQIYGDVERHLKSCVWLPDTDSYTVLSLAVMVSYVQQIFDAVPLILANGRPGTGKTQLGIGMAEIANAGVVVGAVSAATMSRMINESRGFTVLDDLESITNKGGDNRFSEMIQYLKVSYNKKSGVRQITDPKSQRTVELNFFGVKLINNTVGVDDILGSRMFCIYTRNIPDSAKEEFGARPRLTQDQKRALRDELHTWAFLSATDVQIQYNMTSPNKTDRGDEISASVRTIAELIGDDEIRKSLEKAIQRMRNKDDLLPAPEEMVLEALKRCVVQGFNWVTVEQVRLELRSLIDPYTGVDFTSQIPEFWKPEWIGRRMRETGWIDTENHLTKRVQVGGGGRRVRAAKVKDEHIEEAFLWAAGSGDENLTSLINNNFFGEDGAGSFCRGCETCRYAMVGCDIREKVEAITHGKNKSSSKAAH